MRKRGGIARLLTGVAVVLLVVAVVDLRVRPMVEYQLEYLARRYAFTLINEAMLTELEGERIPYGELALVSRGEDGMVTSIETDLRAANLLRARTADMVSKHLSQRERQAITVPLGTLFGTPVTAGRGPGIEIRVIPVGYVESAFASRFEEAGINQTLHRIVLTTRVRIAAVLPGFSVETAAEADYCVAETVVVGAVPEGFTVVNGDSGGTIERINDYGQTGNRG